MGMFDGKVALVTGATSGIGKATALHFAAEGAKVVVAGRRLSQGYTVADEIKAAGGCATFIQADVTQESQVKELARKTVEVYGSLDYAFNNAGMGGSDVPMHQIILEDWNRIIKTNLTSVFLCMRYEILQMLIQESGVVVNNASAIGLVGLKDAADYSASKHGVIGLTKSAALDYAQQGIRVNAICPGWVESELTQSVIRYSPERIVASTPMGRYASPE